MRLFCFDCGKKVTTELPDNTIFRGVAQCPECIEEKEKGCSQCDERKSNGMYDYNYCSYCGRKF